jgi:HEAT repeat protein
MEGKNAWEFLPLLLMLLKNADFSLREELFRVLKGYPAEYLLPELLSIMRGRYPLSVQRDVMRLLSQCREPFCVQQLLEGLPVLDPAISQEIFSTLFQIFPDEVRRMLEFAFTSCDARLKTRFLLCVPSVSDRELKTYVYKGLTDDDKHVRLQALKALKEYEDPCPW